MADNTEQLHKAKPGDQQRDEWACLDELDWQAMDMGEQQWVDMPRPKAIGFGLVHGPAAVRVRRKGGWDE